MKTLIRNCKIVSPGVEHQGVIEIENDRIKTVACYQAEPDDRAYDKIIDGRELTAVPGFIDIHCHGIKGYDVMDGSPEAIEKIAEAKINDGVTGFCPTTLTVSKDELLKAAESVRVYTGNQNQARCLGMHLEGPFVNPKFLGAQNPDYVRKPDINEVRHISSITKVAIVSLAAEMEGGLDVIRKLAEDGVVASCAHSGARYSEFISAKAAGLKHLTHFCNQMSPLHHREIGLVGAGLSDNDIKLEMICDFIHLSPDMIKLIFKCRTIDSLLFITDSMGATCLGDGKYSLGGLEVIVRDSVARLASNGSIAGSTLRYFKGLKNVMELMNLPLKEIIRATSLNQALSLGIDDLGKIEKGYLADITLLDRNFIPVHVFVNGRMVK